MSLETKIKQSAGLMALAIGIGLFTKYTGIDDTITPDKNNQQSKTEQTEEQTFEERYKQLTAPTYNKKIIKKEIKQKPIETKNITKNKIKTKENKPVIKQKPKTTVETILEEEHNYGTNSKHNSSNYKSYDNTSNNKKKVFIYHQNLSSQDMMKESMEVTDYWMPHFYEIEQEKIGYDKKRKKDITKTVWKNRVNDKTLQDIVNSVNTKNVMPMVSAFERKSVMSVLDNPYDYAKKIHEEIKKVGANGVSIDLESIDVGKEESKKLTNFMKILREEMPGYILTIAVSPRFEGIAEEGFKHHGFYNYKELSKYADYINIMCYDFHKGRVSPIMPAHLVESILDYAKKNIPKDKIVPLFPLYSNVWEINKKGTYKDIGALNSKYLDNFAKENGIDSKYYTDGELRIKTKNGKIVYGQDGTTFYNRLKRVQNHDIKNFGGWKQNHASKDMYNQIKWWKQKK
jgi:spore germination protein YaaH